MHIIPIIISLDMTATKLLAYDEKFDINLMFSPQKYNTEFDFATEKSNFIKKCQKMSRRGSEYQVYKNQIFSGI